MTGAVTTLDLSVVSDRFLIRFALWFAVEWPAWREKISDGKGDRVTLNAIMREAQRRQWPDGWYEDPSVIPSEGARLSDDQEGGS